jgi:Protein of unknown function (DUF3987)
MSDSPIDLVLPKLSRATPNGHGWLACCPAHEDQTPSLSINQGDDGRVLLKCFAGCSHEAIMEALGLQSKDLFVPRDSHNGKRPTNGKAASKPKSPAEPKGARYATAGDAVRAMVAKLGQPSRQWTYNDASGKPVALVLRFDKPDGSKEFRPVSLHEDGGWYAKAPATPRPLYGLPDVADETTVYVCEGEKAADAARSIGLVAVTSMSGAQSPEKSDWTPLVGKTVVILPDSDDAGRKYAETVVGILHRLDGSTKAKIVELPGLPPKGDIVEWIEAHGDAAEPETMRQDLERLVAETAPVEAEPVVSRVERLDYTPFPVDELPKIVRDFVVDGSKSIGCDPAFLAAYVLPVLASAIGGSHKLRIKRRWLVPSILWSCVVAHSGAAKSPPYRLAKSLIDTRHEQSLRDNAEAAKQYEGELLRYERSVVEWKKSKAGGSPPEKPDAPACIRYAVEDSTLEALAPILAANPRGVFDGWDELAGWLGSFDKYSASGGNDMARWLSVYNAEPFTIDRKTGVPKTVYIKRPSVSITGSIQPDTLRRALTRESRSSGLAARLLIVWPPRRAKRWTEDDIDEAVEARMMQLVERLYSLEMMTDEHGEPVPMTINLTPDAKRLFVTYFDDHNAEQLELDGDLGAAWSKLEEVAARIALVIHYVREASDEPGLPRPVAVDAESMRRGIALTEWFKHEARRVYAMLEESEDESEQRKLVEWIARKGGTVTAREVQQGNRRFKTADDAETSLQELVTAGIGRWELTPAGKRGQPTRRFILPSTSTVFTNPS